MAIFYLNNEISSALSLHIPTLLFLSLLICPLRQTDLVIKTLDEYHLGEWPNLMAVKVTRLKPLQLLITGLRKGYRLRASYVEHHWSAEGSDCTSPTARSRRYIWQDFDRTDLTVWRLSYYERSTHSICKTPDDKLWHSVLRLPFVTSTEAQLPLYSILYK
jgi:hypothetical protein